MEYLNSGIAWFAQVAFNTLFTAADENLPLSMVRVKNKPQHLVFWSHFVHQLSKPRTLPVETSIQPCRSRVWMAPKCPKLGATPGSRFKASAHSSTLAPVRLRHKAQNRCTSPALLFKLWTFGTCGAAFASIKAQSATRLEASVDGARGRCEFLRSQCDKTQHVSHVRTGVSPD